MGKDKVTIRTLGVKSWPTKGQTSDNGIGSRAKAVLAELEKEEDQDGKLVVKSADGMKDAYNDAVRAVKGWTQAEQRAILLAAASDFTWEALVEKAASGRTVASKTVDEESWDRVKAVAGWEKMGPEKLIAAFGEAKEKVRAERAAKSEAKKAAKGKGK